MAANQLSDAEAERLALLIEECGEAIQAAGKILRHGYDSKYPGVDNRASLEREVGDILTVVNMMYGKDIAYMRVADRVKEKTETVKQYLHHQDDPLRT